MRNYIKTLGIQWDFFFDDGMGGNGQFLLTAIAGDEDELWTQFAKINAVAEQGFPPGYTFSTVARGDPKEICFLLSKPAYLKMVQDINPQIWWDQAALGKLGSIKASLGESPWDDPELWPTSDGGRKKGGGATQQSFPGPFLRWIIRFRNYLTATQQFKKRDQLVAAVHGFETGKLTMFKFVLVLRDILDKSGFK